MQFFAKNQRLTTGLALAAIFAVTVMLGGWFARGILAVVVSIALWEFYEMFWPRGQRMVLKVIGILCGAGYVCAYGLVLGWGAMFLGFVMGLTALAFLFDFGRGNTTAKLTDYTPIPLGIVYIPLLLSPILVLSAAEQVLVILAAIGTDAGGYYLGSAIGKHKMWPSVSPKKSWEGSAGGLLGCIAVCVGIGLLQPSLTLNMPAFPWWGWILVGVFLNMSAQLGDFFESALKRSMGVKDSGSLLPGHGGFLDRIDSVLFVVPVYYLIHLGNSFFAG